MVGLTRHDSPPAPHPLDFDWRYDERTARALAEILFNAGPILSIGAPTIARILEANGIDVTLVDHQPIQGVRRHIVADVDRFVADRIYRTAIVDPPWYPTYLEDWTKTAARAVGVGGTVLVSVWPCGTRPAGDIELSSTIKKLSRWGKIQRDFAILTYNVPRFETVALEVGIESDLSRSPRSGELVRIDVETVPDGPPQRMATQRWVRFVIDDYQLAIRRADRSGSNCMEQHPNASGWRWPFVSARAPALDQIDIWSSEGEVATLGSPKRLIEALRYALAASDRSAFEGALADAPALLTWRIPRPPYRRSIEWLSQR